MLKLMYMEQKNVIVENISIFGCVDKKVYVYFYLFDFFLFFFYL